MAKSTCFALCLDVFDIRFTRLVFRWVRMAFMRGRDCWLSTGLLAVAKPAGKRSRRPFAVVHGFIGINHRIAHSFIDQRAQRLGRCGEGLRLTPLVWFLVLPVDTFIWVKGVALQAEFSV